MITLDGFELPEEMIWLDEFTWSTVKATTTRTIQGKYIVRESSVPDNAGRPITLTSDNAWAERDAVIQLRSWTDDTLRELVLVMHDGSTFACRFRHWEEPLTAELVLPHAFPESTTLYKITLRLAVVE